MCIHICTYLYVHISICLVVCAKIDSFHELLFSPALRFANGVILFPFKRLTDSEDLIPSSGYVDVNVNRPGHEEICSPQQTSEDEVPPAPASTHHNFTEMASRQVVSCNFCLKKVSSHCIYTSMGE